MSTSGEGKEAFTDKILNHILHTNLLKENFLSFHQRLILITILTHKSTFNFSVVMLCSMYWIILITKFEKVQIKIKKF